MAGQGEPMSAGTPLGTVYFEETGEEREVVSMCKLCARVDPSFAYESIADVPIVSPSGVGHHSSGYGVTDCGKDATGEGWWWRL